MTGEVETRRTDWWSVAGADAWRGSDIIGYRIWQQHDGRRWWQRHEWKFEDGSTRLEDWIDGASGWLPHALPVAAEAVP